ncbi:MAG: hypothetical protein Q7T86_03735 [Hyphomicrobiaceae bacterium]|nr:hypothetical protein [Hyphomicrobiaceae bacterium]
MTDRHDRAEFSRRLAVTLVAIAAYLLATRIPLSGINPAALSQLANLDYAGSVISRMSIGALGMMPAFSAICIGELVRLVGPRKWRGPGSAAPDWLIWLALAFAAMQAGGVATALEAAGSPALPIVPEPGLAFRVACVGSMVGATALFWWLASLISRHGLGSGFWVLFVTLFVMEIPKDLAVLADLLRSGAVAAPAVAIVVGYAVLTVGFAVFFYSTNDNPERGAALLWPNLLVPVIVNILLMPIGLYLALQDATFPDWIPDIIIQNRSAWLASQVALIQLTIHVALIGFVVYLRHRRSAHPLAARQNGVLAAGLIAIAVFGRLIVPGAASVLTNGPILIIITVVVLEMLGDWRARFRHTGAPTALTVHTDGSPIASR